MRDWFSKAFGAAIDDVRNEWERFCYGRAVTPTHPTLTVGTPDRSAGEDSPAERLGWSRPGEAAARPSGSGWFERTFAPDAAREANHADRAARSHEQEQGLER